MSRSCNSLRRFDEIFCLTPVNQCSRILAFASCIQNILKYRFFYLFACLIDLMPLQHSNYVIIHPINIFHDVHLVFCTAQPPGWKRYIRRSNLMYIFPNHSLLLFPPSIFMGLCDSRSLSFQWFTSPSSPHSRVPVPVSLPPEKKTPKKTGRKTQDRRAGERSCAQKDISTAASKGGWGLGVSFRLFLDTFWL